MQNSDIIGEVVEAVGEEKASEFGKVIAEEVSKSYSHMFDTTVIALLLKAGVVSATLSRPEATKIQNALESGRYVLESEEGAGDTFTLTLVEDTSKPEPSDEDPFLAALLKAFAEL